MTNPTLAADLLRKLLPCPWCGCTKITTHEGSTFRWMAVECAECGAGPGEIRVQTIGDGTPQDWEKQAQANVVKAWNTRRPQMTEAELYDVYMKSRMYDAVLDKEHWLGYLACAKHYGLVKP